MSFVFLFLTSQLVFSATPQCLPAKEEILIPHEGYYHRIHPSGNYFIYTYTDKSYLVDVTDRKNPKAIQTPMREEAYPVEAPTGGWELIAAPIAGGGHGPRSGTDYFKFENLLDKKSGTKPSYKDPGHGEYYLSSAELQGSTPTQKKIRTLLYSDREYRDYNLKLNAEGKVISSKKSKVKKLCSNIFKPIDFKAPGYKKFNAEMDAIQKMDEQLSQLVNQGASEDKRAKLRSEINARTEAAEIAFYGPEFEKALRKNQELTLIKEKALLELTQTPGYIEIQNEFTELNKEKREIADQVSRDPKVFDYATRLPKAEALQKNQPSQKHLEKYTQLMVANERAIEEKSNELGLEKIQNKINALQIKKEKFVANDPIGIKFKELEAEQRDTDMTIWHYRENSNFDNPILSKNGEYVAGLVSGNIHIYKISNNGDCTLEDKTSFRGSKASFSYPEPGKKPKITFTTSGSYAEDYQATGWVYDLETKQTTKLSESYENAYYPGFMKDGRVMFKSNNKMVIVDPEQLNGKPATCAAILEPPEKAEAQK